MAPKHNKIKANIPEEWTNTLKTNNTQTPISPILNINSELQLYANGKYLEPNKFKLKLIHNHLMDETYKPKCEAKWEALFNQTFNWKSI